MSRHRIIKDFAEKTGRMVGNVRCHAVRHYTLALFKISRKPECHSGSHVFDFLHKPIVYGVVHLLYSVMTSDSVNKGTFAARSCSAVNLFIFVYVSEYSYVEGGGYFVAICGQI